MTRRPASTIAIASPTRHPRRHASQRPGPRTHQVHQAGEHEEGVDLPKRMPSLTGCSHSMGAATARATGEPGAEADEKGARHTR